MYQTDPINTIREEHSVIDYIEIYEIKKASSFFESKPHALNFSSKSNKLNKILKINYLGTKVLK